MIKFDEYPTIYDVSDIERMTNFTVIQQLRYNWWLCYDQMKNFGGYLLLVKPLDNDRDYLMVDLKGSMTAFKVINNEVSEIDTFKEMYDLWFNGGML